MANVDSEFGEGPWANWDSLSEKDQYYALVAYQLDKGRILATSREGNFFKRWVDVFDKPTGIEFRPLKRADYGYPDDLNLSLNWTMWVVQTLATLKISVKRGVLLLVVSMLLNDFVRPKFKDGVGSSFVWNVQTGYNLVQWIRNGHKWSKYAAWAGLGLDGPS